MNETMFSKPHRRYNPLTDEWVLVSPHRTQRPWQGQQEDVPLDTRPAFDPTCYLCPGNARAGGKRNPNYKTTFVFDNDFAALLEDTPSAELDREGLLVARSERGICRVVCFSPRHDLSLPELEPAALLQVIDTWIEQVIDLGQRPWISYVQIFENKGAMMGASNPHPHGQIWATESIPDQAAKELASCGQYSDENGTCLLCDVLSLELAEATRVVCENEHFAVLVPFWAVWPFEVLLLSKRHLSSLPELSVVERDALADILQWLTTRFDNLFRASFPYSMGFHQRPTDGGDHPELHLHAHFYPPLLRSATVRKFMVGYEMLAEPQRDITPESAAARLRALPEEHYRDQ
jgi:UDPglucose--hexose-1-phosphate uridylyltransferase